MEEEDVVMREHAETIVMMQETGRMMLRLTSTRTHTRSKQKPKDVLRVRYWPYRGASDAFADWLIEFQAPRHATR